MARREITLTVNGRETTCTVDDRMLLADLLRDQLRLTGTKVACGQGACGSCTVHVDGVPRRSCLTFAVQADGRTIRTVESLAEGGALNELQAAFQRCHALQCGFCTPGLLMSLQPLVERGTPVTEEEAVEAVSSNLCRCTGYEPIVDAVLEVAGQREEQA